MLREPQNLAPAGPRTRLWAFTKAARGGWSRLHGYFQSYDTSFEHAEQCRYGIRQPSVRIWIIQHDLEGLLQQALARSSRAIASTHIRRCTDLAPLVGCSKPGPVSSQRTLRRIGPWKSGRAGASITPNGVAADACEHPGHKASVSGALATRICFRFGTRHSRTFARRASHSSACSLPSEDVAIRSMLLEHSIHRSSGEFRPNVD